jgi:uncharacterized protein (DUF1501 family)
MSRRHRRLRQMNQDDPSRRDFLFKGACAALTATGIASSIVDLRLISAAMADTLTGTSAITSDYKALVCIFLFGGNDGNNLIVPTDSNYTGYSNSRGVLAIPNVGQANGLLALTSVQSDGHTYGLNPRMPELANLYNTDGKLAILCNVGTLLAPLTQQQYKNHSVAVPPQLFSHSDQQVEWQTAAEDQQPKTGWGGRSADLLYSLNTSNNVSMNISLAGSNTFQVGDVINEYNVSTTGAVSLNIPTSGQGPAQLQALKDLISMNHTNLYESAFSSTMNAALTNAATLNAAIAPTAAANFFTTPFPASSLGNQLKMIARLIAAAPTLGHNRQVFFASTGGFDLHSTEGSSGGAQGNLLADVSACMNALYQATKQLNVASSVTQFTASDFSRTFPVNSDSGADHAWGNHQLILGGAVQGKKLYGTFPTLAVNGPDDTSTGRWIPTIAVEQYCATLAKWFGVSATMIPQVFPYVGRFATPDLGFMS